MSLRKAGWNWVDGDRFFDREVEIKALSSRVRDGTHTLQHDGYLASEGNGYRFVSGLLEDWWRARHGRHFVPIDERQVRTK